MVGRMTTNAGKALCRRRSSAIEMTYRYFKDAMGFRGLTNCGFCGLARIQTE